MERMEQSLEILTTEPPLLNLNEHMQILETCGRSHIQEILISCIILEKSTKGTSINSILFHIGPYISSLEISLFNLNLDISKYLEIIDRHCSNLKCLKIDHCIGITVKTVPSVYNFPNVEMLTLFRFNSSSTKRFLQSFRHLKALYIVECSINWEETMTILHNNPNIDTFHSYGLDCLKFLPLIPNVQKLWVGGCHKFEFLPNVWTLFTLNCLTKLKLDCEGNNINYVLRELAKKGIMEEMELENIDVDDDFFDILVSFEKIQLLAIDYAQRYDENKRLKTSIVWPTKLNSLRLWNFELTLNDFIEIIRQLTSLQRMDMCSSYFAESELNNFEDSKKCLRETLPRILKAVDTSNGNQCREIRFGYIYSDAEEVTEDTSKYWIDTDRLKIIRKRLFEDCDHLGIEIDFPIIKDL